MEQEFTRKAYKERERERENGRKRNFRLDQMHKMKLVGFG